MFYTIRKKCSLLTNWADDISSSEALNSSTQGVFVKLETLFILCQDRLLWGRGEEAERRGEGRDRKERRGEERRGEREKE